MGFTTIIESSSARTLSTSDVDGYIKMSNVAGGVVTIPANVTDPIPVNSSILVQRTTDGAVGIALEGGVTLNKPVLFTDNIRAKWSNIVLLKTDTDTWDVTGDLAMNTSPLYMQAGTYDPTGVEGDAFDMENMVEGATNKIMTDAERTAIGDNTTAIGDNATAIGDNTTAIGDNTTAIALKSDKTFATVDLTGSPATILDTHVDEVVFVDDTVTLGTHPIGFNCLIINDSDSAVAWDATGLTILGSADTLISARGSISLLYKTTSVAYLDGRTE